MTKKASNARAHSLVEAPNPTRRPAWVPDSLCGLEFRSQPYQLSGDSWKSVSLEDGHELHFAGRESIHHVEWVAPPVETATERTRGKLGDPLPDQWWGPASTCARRHSAARGWTMQTPSAERCRDPHCESCRLKRIGRRTRDVRAASVPHLLRGARLILITTTRKPGNGQIYTGSPRGVARFQAANKVLTAQLRWAGVLGGATVYEAKIHREKPGSSKCCESAQGCPMCGSTGGFLPESHLHAHHIVLVPKRWVIAYSWLHQLQLPRAIDHRWGRIDVSRGSTKRGADSLGAYVGGYLSRLKESSGCQTAWIRRCLGKHGRSFSSWGVLRGAARSGANVEIVGEQDNKTVIDIDRHILVRTVRPSRPDVEATARDAARVLRSKGIAIKEPWQALAEADRLTFAKCEQQRKATKNRGNILKLRSPEWVRKQAQRLERLQ